MFDYTDNLAIDTPENVILDAEIAGLGTRSVAAMIDYLILGVVFAILIYLFLSSQRNQQNSTLLFVAVYTMLQLGLIIYHLTFEFLWNGQTPGKRILGLRVIQSNGLPMTTTGALIRNFARLFDFFPMFYAVGLISMFITKRTQRLGDLAARTIVIREQKQIKLEALSETLNPNYQYIHVLSVIPPYIQIAPLNDEDRRLIFDYLQRRTTLQNRPYVVDVLARRIARHMGVSEETLQLNFEGRAEVFLEQTARAFELAQRNQPSQSGSISRNPIF